MASIDRISIELTNRCQKGCSFCYNSSSSSGATHWKLGEVLEFVLSCAAGGVKAVSFGGGEPLEFPEVFDLLKSLDGVVFRSLTTHGLLLDRDNMACLARSRPDKIHVSIHFPGVRAEVDRAVRQTQELAALGIRSGINLLVRRSQLREATAAASQIRDAGIDASRVIYLPMRGRDTPSPSEIAAVAGSGQFQSMSCLGGCAKSPRFCSIDWNRRVAWCSYTRSRLPLDELSFTRLVQLLGALDLEYCGDDLVTLNAS